MACTFPLRAHWFSECIKDFIKRAEMQRPVPETKVVNPRSVLERPSTPTPSGPMSHSSMYGSRCGTPSSRAGYGHVGWENRRRMVPPVATDDGLDGVVEAFNCLPLAVPSDSHYRYHNDDKNHLYPLRDDDLVYAYMRICGI
ncbi:hypothetical protein PAXINDRAFT_101117 [Paxillus involutus ATCC 200175]|uniref:Unplaced genomic scaffold PAXINscaffold_39, whole genome shotgun sequence n=1 Tax=Paxillus involutus ATCC 200175 TaxID=664439 RepID=A0A0C9SUE7_PAXIN|nr:hypothetical protein PAXINDRAFT_101117 [Paxillus involutus ATCC 200175]